MDNLDIPHLYRLYLCTYSAAVRGKETSTNSMSLAEVAAVARATYHAAPAHGRGQESRIGAPDSHREFARCLVDMLRAG